MVGTAQMQRINISKSNMLEKVAVSIGCYWKLLEAIEDYRRLLEAIGGYW